LVPEVLGETIRCNWALPSVPYAGDGSGHFLIPPAEAGVWIEFEAGDVSRPVWTGCWWATDGRPADASGTMAEPDLKIIRSEKGLIIALDDQGESISLSDKNGSNLVEIKVQQGLITVKSAVKVVAEAPQIELVQSAMHPLVFGDQLLSYLNQLVAMFNAHLHPGEMALGVFPVTPAPPVPMFPPATAALLSTKVKTG
jgi:hypothetical protein